jgi:hypothetical protein
MPFYHGERHRTLDAWIQIDTAQSHVISNQTIELENGKIVVEVRTKEPDPVLEGMRLYFRFQDRLFKAVVLYWRGNPNRVQLVQTMRQIVLSLKPSP